MLVYGLKALNILLFQEEATTEYVVVQDGELNMEDLQNVKIVTDGEVDGSFLEGVQVTDLDGVQITEEYVLVTDDTENVKIVDSRTGETLATMLPLSSLAEGDGQVLTLPAEDNEITTVTMDTENVETMTTAGELVTNDTEYQMETVVQHSNNEIEAVAMAPNVDVTETMQVVISEDIEHSEEL